MHDHSRFRIPVAFLGLVAMAALVACERTETQVGRDEPADGTDQAAPGQLYDVPEVSEVRVSVSGCRANPNNDTITVRIDPLVAGLARGADLDWVIETVENQQVNRVTIRAKDQDWLFPGWQADAANRRNSSVEIPAAGTHRVRGLQAQGDSGAVFRYSVLLRCQNRVFEVDPELIIVRGD